MLNYLVSLAARVRASRALKLYGEIAADRPEVEDMRVCSFIAISGQQNLVIPGNLASRR